MKISRILLPVVLFAGVITPVWSGGVTTYSADPPIVAAIQASTTAVEPGGTIVFTASDGLVGAAYDRDTEFLDGNFHSYVTDTISISWQATNSSGVPSGVPTSGSGSSFTWTAPTTPPTLTTVYTITMTVTDGHIHGSASDDEDVSGTKAKKFKVDVRYTLQCGILKMGVLNAQDAFSATNLPNAYAKQYSLNIPTAQDTDVSIDTYRNGGTFNPYTALIEEGNPRTIVAWKGPVTVGGVPHSTINYRAKANTAYTLEVTSTEPNQIGSFIVTMSGCAALPTDPTAVAMDNDEGVLAGLTVDPSSLMPGDYRSDIYGSVELAPLHYTVCGNDWTGPMSGRVYLTSDNPRVVWFDNPFVDLTFPFQSGSMPFTMHVLWPQTPTTVRITATHFYHEYQVNDLMCAINRLPTPVGPSTTYYDLVFTPNGISVPEIYLDNTVFEPANRSRAVIDCISSQPYSLFRDGGMIASVVDPATRYVTDDYPFLAPENVGKKHVYFRSANGAGYTEISYVRIVANSVSSSENQTVDTRIDPRYATPPLLNYAFKAKTYNGGLFVGATKVQETVDQQTVYGVNDPSGTSRSFLKFQLPDPIIGGAWRAGSVNAYCTTYRESSAGVTNAGVACIPISNDGWDQEWLQWSRSLTFLPGGFNPANALDYQKVTIPFDHVGRWYSWNLRDRFGALAVQDRVLSAVLASPSEPPNADPNAWMYFAKKEYQNGAYKPYALCLYQW